MARQNQPSERNTFVGGFVTEVSPLTFPDNAAIDIANFQLDKSGTIKRRLGMDYEDGKVDRTAGYTTSSTQPPVCAVFNWENPGGISNKKLIVTQVGYVISVYDATQVPISSEQLYTASIGNKGWEAFDGAVVDGVFYLSAGTAEIHKLEYDGTSITKTTARLKVRDTFGVEHTVDGVDYRDPENVDRRISSGSAEAESVHEYNLRNGAWATKRYAANEETLEDPIKTFFDSTSVGGSLDGAFNPYDYRDGVVILPEDDEWQGPVNTTGFLPSYADKLNSAIITDAADEDDRNAERFFPKLLVSGSDVGKAPAPTGRFIIDLLDRGSSRVSEMTKLLASSTYSSRFEGADLPADRTPDGAKCVAEFAGRVFYAGFSGEVIGGDKYSPKLSSYVLFSKLVDSPTDSNQCLQVADPTSKDNFELVDTDGGYIRLDGAYNIQRLINIGGSLIVLAENGVWAITGGSDYGFTASDNRVDKISDKGCVAKRSVTLVEGNVIYWASDGIYVIGRTETGALNSTNMTSKAIQSFYNDIPTNDKVNCQGFYDSYDSKVRWVYGNDLLSATESRELIFDPELGSFYKNTFPNTDSGFPVLCALFEVPPYRTGLQISNVLVGNDDVKSGSDDVVATIQESVGGSREVSYLAATKSGRTLYYGFATYKDTNFVDWFSHDGTGVDAEAFMITGYDGGGDFQRNKQAPYVTFHFNRTEDGFEADAEGDLYPTNQSSCLVQAHWDWTNSANSNRWTKPFQAYRYKRFYMPEDGNDPYDTGDSVISTKNRLRGKGKVLSLKINSEPNKDCQLLGWSMLMGIGTSV